MDTQKVCEGRPERPDPTLRIAALKGSMESRTDAVCTACTPQPGQRAWSLDSGVVNDWCWRMEWSKHVHRKCSKHHVFIKADTNNICLWELLTHVLIGTEENMFTRGCAKQPDSATKKSTKAKAFEQTAGRARRERVRHGCSNPPCSSWLWSPADSALQDTGGEIVHMPLFN